ncbi:PleD family two-component system response regulator [Aestuariispira insulae]|uniref:diguanylate cyclase n=1 Tax=Aestuariispira insulae TaxID=1461337 RepID=A0A3D9HN52_9PROT|nr:PleD family two-component system response regulator [Aestuariispira insulae]RED50899.1 response regulator receiver modulated diguanylate cyclase [Aestuariispira insulae]
MTARVLVVDDLKPNVKLLEAKLTAEYFDVITASDGPSALVAVDEHSPDIILLDVMMPGMDGFEVCRRIKENPATMHIPVIMVTALSDSTDRVRGLESGADDFLTKPVNDTAMFARVRSLVRLKMMTDEWRLREQTSGQLGVIRNEEPLSTVDASHAQVLVVEDSRVDSAKIVDTLAQDNDDVIAVTNLTDAEAQLAEKRFELVVINLRLRQEDALRFCSHMRAKEVTRATPILMVAEEDDTDRLAKGLDLGINDYLIKPIDRNELLARSRTQIRRQRYQDRLRDNYERSLAMALTDSLTGLYNRRYVTAHLGGMIEQHARSGKPLSLLVFDIDFFKTVNDSYGHAAGDEVLIELSQRVVKNVRNVDMVARMGGEEFMVIMPDTDMEIAALISDRLRDYVSMDPYVFQEQPEGITISISIGLTTMQSDDDADSLFKKADDALYEAKRQGRNRVVAWIEGEMVLKGAGEPAQPHGGRKPV